MKRLRRFLGRHIEGIILLILAAAAVVAWYLWHEWDVTLLEQRWFQTLLMLALAAVIFPLAIWAETGEERGQRRRRPRAEREPVRRPVGATRRMRRRSRSRRR